MVSVYVILYGLLVLRPFVHIVIETRLVLPQLRRPHPPCPPAVKATLAPCSFGQRQDIRIWQELKSLVQYRAAYKGRLSIPGLLITLESFRILFSNNGIAG